MCAGAQDPFEIYVWSLQTGRLLDVLAGHEGPISGIVYSPKQVLGEWFSLCASEIICDLYFSYNQSASCTVRNKYLEIESGFHCVLRKTFM